MSTVFLGNGYLRELDWILFAKYVNMEECINLESTHTVYKYHPHGMDNADLEILDDTWKILGMWQPF